MEDPYEKEKAGGGVKKLPRGKRRKENEKHINHGAQQSRGEFNGQKRGGSSEHDSI